MRPAGRNLGIAATIVATLLATGQTARAAAPAATETLSAGGTTSGACFAADPSDAGVASFEAHGPPSFSYVRIELDGAAGDWDVAAFSHGKVVTAGASAAPREVATGYAVPGEKIRIQGCRNPGAAPTATARVYFTPLPDPHGRAPQLLRVRVNGPGDRAALDAAGLDPAESAGPGFADVVSYGAEDRDELERLGLSYTTLDRGPGRKALSSRLARRAAEPMPSGRTGYRRLFDYQQEMKNLAARWPHFVRHFTLPHPSLEGRTVEGVELGDNPGTPEGEPVFLQLGLHHGREWPAGEVTFEWAYELLERAETGDPGALRRLVKSTTIVVPVVNPDGFNISREAGQVRRDYGTRSGDERARIPVLPAEYHRKNCRLPGGRSAGCARAGETQQGVDLNRNYGVNWGGRGAGIVGVDETFRGPEPFSEPEVLNVREIVEHNQVIAASSQHTYAALMLRPPLVRGGGRPPDAPLYRRLGGRLGAETGYDSIPGFQLYDSSGGLDDWSYGATGAITFTPELGLGDFHPAFAQVLREWHGTARRAQGGVRGAFLELSDFVMRRGAAARIAGTGPPGGRLELRKSFAARTARILRRKGPTRTRKRFRNRLRTTVAIGPGGRFEATINPSRSPLLVKRPRRARWEVTCFDADGARTGSRHIRVARGARRVLDLSSGC